MLEYALVLCIVRRGVKKNKIVWLQDFRAIPRKKNLDIVRNFAKSYQHTIFWLFAYSAVLGVLSNRSISKHNTLIEESTINGRSFEVIFILYSRMILQYVSNISVIQNAYIHFKNGLVLCMVVIVIGLTFRNIWNIILHRNRSSYLTITGYQHWQLLVAQYAPYINHLSHWFKMGYASGALPPPPPGKKTRNKQTNK